MILRRWATVCAAAALVMTGAVAPASAAPGASFATIPCWSPNLPGVPSLDLTPDFTCGYLTVPENRSARNGRTIKVGVARVPAVHPRPGANPLVYLAGGQGGTSMAGALDAVTPLSQAYLAARTVSRSKVVVFPGIGHDTAAASDCAMTVMLGFLNDPRRYDTSCVARMKDPAFVT